VLLPGTRVINGRSQAEINMLAIASTDKAVISLARNEFLKLAFMGDILLLHPAVFQSSSINPNT
jgi:hypothetical protein